MRTPRDCGAGEQRRLYGHARQQHDARLAQARYPCFAARRRGSSRARGWQAAARSRPAAHRVCLCVGCASGHRPDAGYPGTRQQRAHEYAGHGRRQLEVVPEARLPHGGRCLASGQTLSNIQPLTP